MLDHLCRNQDGKIFGMVLGGQQFLIIDPFEIIELLCLDHTIKRISLCKSPEDIIDLKMNIESCDSSQIHATCLISSRQAIKFISVMQG